MTGSILEDKIRAKQKQGRPLLCSHSVLGYPNPTTCLEAIHSFCAEGVDLLELQFPFSDPMADGPLLLHANQEALARGTSIDQCFQWAKEVIPKNPNTLFLIMTYYNIIYARGLEHFAQEASEAGALGVIIPDLPIEEAGPWIKALAKAGLAPIFMVTPDTGTARLHEIAAQAKGFLYCVARKGITGTQTKFGSEFASYLKRVRQASRLPLGVGFGIRTKEDVDGLADQTEIVIVCSKAIEILGKQGVAAATSFLKSLR